MRMAARLSALALVLGLTTGAFASAALAADVPAATKKALDELKLDSGILDGLDAELAVPKAWLDAAPKEGAVIILGTWQDAEFREISQAFIERYPTVKLAYTRAASAARGIKVLVALNEGRVIADVITSVGDSYGEFKKQDVLADLRELPGIKNLSAEEYADDGTWVAHKIGFRCMS
jgi:hypothetical protein